MHPPSTILAHRYLDIVAALKTPTANSAIKSHIFRMLKPILDAQPDEKMRERIGKARDVEGYRAVIRDMESLVQVCSSIPVLTRSHSVRRCHMIRR